MRLPLPPSCTPTHTALHPEYNTLPQWYKQDPSSYPSPSWQSSRPGSYQAAYSPPPGPVHESHLCWAPQTPLSPPQTNGVLSEPLGLHTRLDLFPGLMSLPAGGRGGGPGKGWGAWGSRLSMPQSLLRSSLRNQVWWGWDQQLTPWVTSEWTSPRRLQGAFPPNRAGRSLWAQVQIPALCPMENFSKPEAGHL